MMTAKKKFTFSQKQSRQTISRRCIILLYKVKTNNYTEHSQNQQNSMTIKTIKDFFNKKIQKFQQNILRISKIQWPSKLLNIVLTKKL